MDYNLWQELILGSTKPFRTGANILAQNWGSALTGKDMSQSQNQGKFLKWLAGGITPEEQREISERPYLSALKSGAGMAATLAPMASQSLRGVQFATDPLVNRLAQLSSQGLLEGTLGGFGYSDPGNELRDTAMGAVLGPVSEIGADYLTNPSFRGLLNDQVKSMLPQYRNLPNGEMINQANARFSGLLGDQTNGVPGDYQSLQDLAAQDAKHLGGATIDGTIYYDPMALPDTNSEPVIKNWMDNLDGQTKIDLIGDDPIKKLEVEALQYTNPEGFISSLPTGGEEGRALGRGWGYYLVENKPTLSELSKQQLSALGFKGGSLPNKITLYRGVPDGVKHTLVTGDYFSTSKSLASSYGKNVQKFEISPDNLVMDGHGDYVYKGDIKALNSKLTNLWKQAHGKIGRGAKDMASSLSSTYSDILKKR